MRLIVVGLFPLANWDSCYFDKLEIIPANNQYVWFGYGFLMYLCMTLVGLEARIRCLELQAWYANIMYFET
jgi:hypothetical protein